MRWMQVCPLIGAALTSCAVEENEFPLNDSKLSAAGDGGVGGGSAGASAGTFASGGVGTGEAGHAGVSSGGTFGVSGSASFGGTFGSAGAPGQAGASASSGTGGGAGAGSKANGGAGGKASGGAAGTGGAGGASSTACSGVKLPAKSTWKASAMPVAPGDPAARAIDGDEATRFSTGQAQVGGEWLQIDFGASVALNEVAMHTSNDDYFRHYELRLSNTSGDFATAVLKEGDGMTGTITVTLPQPRKGRYLTIRQTGKATPTWWSLFEVDVACN